MVRLAVLCAALAALAIATGVQEMAPGDVRSLEATTRVKIAAHHAQVVKKMVSTGVKLLDQDELGAPAAVAPPAKPKKPAEGSADVETKEQVSKAEIKAKSDAIRKKPAAKTNAASLGKTKPAAKMTLKEMAEREMQLGLAKKRHEERGLKADEQQILAQQHARTEALRREEQKNQKPAAPLKADKAKVLKQQDKATAALRADLAAIEGPAQKRVARIKAMNVQRVKKLKKAAQETGIKKAQQLKVSQDAIRKEEQKIRMQQVIQKYNPSAKMLSPKQKAEEELRQMLMAKDPNAKLSKVLAAKP